MWLMARKRIESWFYWIIVDMIGIWLYFVKDVKFVALLYVILLALAFNGLRPVEAGPDFDCLRDNHHRRAHPAELATVPRQSLPVPDRYPPLCIRVDQSRP